MFIYRTLEFGAIGGYFKFFSHGGYFWAQLSGVENGAENGLPVEGFNFCQYSLLALNKN